ncbi:hypothetical protein GCM10010433_77120 [Streptomyces pulveraceus]
MVLGRGRLRRARTKLQDALFMLPPVREARSVWAPGIGADHEHGWAMYLDGDRLIGPPCAVRRADISPVLARAPRT